MIPDVRFLEGLVLLQSPSRFVYHSIPAKLKMVVESRWSVDIPQCSIPTWLFKSPASPRSDEKQFIDAEKPETHFITQEGYRLWSQRLALGLQREGLRPGDRVLIFSPSSIVFPVGFMGIVMAGGVFTGANPGFTARELLYQIRDSGATFILAADKVVDTAVQAATEAGLARSKIFTLDTTIFDAKPGTPRLGTRHWTEPWRLKQTQSLSNGSNLLILKTLPCV